MSTVNEVVLDEVFKEDVLLKTSKEIRCLFGNEELCPWCSRELHGTGFVLQFSNESNNSIAKTE